MTHLHHTLWPAGCAGLLLALSATGTWSQGDRFHLLFWEPGDICDGRGVDFAAHPLRDDQATPLIAADPDRPALWYSPTDVVRVDDEWLVYYQRIDNGEPDYLDRRTLCMGILRGRELVLPDLRLYPQSWPGPANVVMRRSPLPSSWGGFNVHQIVGQPGGGFRMLYWDQPEDGLPGGMLADSGDGLRWRAHPQRAVFTEHNDAFTLVRSLQAPTYLLYQTCLLPWPEKPFPDNLSGRRRVISLRRSEDLREWSGQQVILEPDGQDAAACEFYLLKVFHHVDRLVGLLLKYYADPETPDRHSSLTRTELVFSRDGERWTRPYRYTDLGVWTYADPFLHEGDLCLVARRDKGISLFRTRRDGLASCGTANQGSFCTSIFIMPEEDLLLNADAGEGSIAVEILSPNGSVLEGFSAEHCLLEGVSAPDLRLHWADRTASELAGQPVRLRFVLDNVRVYALWSTPPPG